jgi:hypothetical protein
VRSENAAGLIQKETQKDRNIGVVWLITMEWGGGKIYHGYYEF